MFAAHSRGPGAAELLRDVREDASILTALGKEPRSFRVAMTSPMGIKRGRGRGTFIDSVLDAIDDFYAGVMQHLKAWSAAPPRLRQIEAEQVEEERRGAPALVSTALSSQDGGTTDQAAPTPERLVVHRGSEVEVDPDTAAGSAPQAVARDATAADVSAETSGRP